MLPYNNVIEQGSGRVEEHLPVRAPRIRSYVENSHGNATAVNDAENRPRVVETLAQRIGLGAYESAHCF